MTKRGLDAQRISPQLDDLSCSLMGEALDRLAEGADINVLLSVADARENAVDFEFANDGEEACLTGARDKVRSLRRAKGDVSLGIGAPRCYAICYEGAVADETGSFADALILEFGETGRTAYSAYSLFDGRGRSEDFVWSDPAPAGEVENLLGK